MIKNLILLSLIACTVTSKTLLVPIDYTYTLDIYYNFKNNPLIQVSAVDEGIEVYIPDILSKGNIQKRSASLECDDLLDGMIVFNADKSSQNTLVTWDQFDVFHLINGNTGQEIEYEHVIQQDCSSPLKTTTLLTSSATSTTNASTTATISSGPYSYHLSYASDAESFIGSLKSGHPLNYTTYIPLIDYNQTHTETIFSTNSVGSVSTSINIYESEVKQTTSYGISNTLAIVAPAQLTTTTVTTYTSGITYTLYSTVKTCQNNDILSECSMTTLSTLVVGDDSTFLPVTYASTTKTAGTNLVVVTTKKTSYSSLALFSDVSSETHKSLTYKTSQSANTTQQISSYHDAAGKRVAEKSIFVVLLAVIINYII
ncbi:hypothetical protein QEN19_002935 [Hanseniaspora menglaensis]